MPQVYWLTSTFTSSSHLTGLRTCVNAETIERRLVMKTCWFYSEMTHKVTLYEISYQRLYRKYNSDLL